MPCWALPLGLAGRGGGDGHGDAEMHGVGLGETGCAGGDVWRPERRCARKTIVETTVTNTL